MCDHDINGGFDILTWNVNGLDATALDERSEAAAMMVIMGHTLEAVTEGAPPWQAPDVIMLQEVVARSYHAHFKQHLKAAGYSLLPNRPPERGYFELIALRPHLIAVDVHYEPLDRSQFGRWLMRVDLDGPMGPLRVVTAHFDSGAGASEIRAKQLAHVDYEMDVPHGRAVFGGDANLRKHEWLDRSHRLRLRDGWELAGQPPESRMTWFGDGDRRARFDRVFVSDGLTCTALTAIGREPLPALGVRVSDHIALRASLALRA